MKITKQDIKVELETYRQTRQGLDEMYSDVWKQLKEEKKVRLVSCEPEGLQKGFPRVPVRDFFSTFHPTDTHGQFKIVPLKKKTPFTTQLGIVTYIFLFCKLSKGLL